MSNKPEECLDRRDFMIASIATVGASAALAANAGSSWRGVKHHGIIAGPMGRTGKDMGIFVGNSGYVYSRTVVDLSSCWSS
jgi:hypothetical protein